VDNLDRGTRFYFGGAKLVIISVPDYAVSEKSSVIADSADIAGCYAAVKAAGSAVILSELKSSEGVRYFSFRDPSGHTMTVQESSGDAKIQWGRKSFFDTVTVALVPAADMEQSRIFYSELLGLKAEGSRFTAGRGFLELTAPGKIVSTLGLEAFNVNDCYRKLKERKIAFLADLRDNYYGTRLFKIQDPAGNKIEIYSWLENIRDAEAKV
jgi:predicted enzyme related to lactoylglutathione lyase